MLCLPSAQLPTDILFWVSRASFLQHFDQHDFLCRDVQMVVDAYLEDWFYIDDSGSRRFKIPVVSVHSGMTQFIGGRHRTAVLLGHLDRVPLAFDTRDLDLRDREWIDVIVDSTLDPDGEFELPDLPIRIMLP